MHWSQTHELSIIDVIYFTTKYQHSHQGSICHCSMKWILEDRSTCKIPKYFYSLPVMHKEYLDHVFRIRWHQCMFFCRCSIESRFCKSNDKILQCCSNCVDKFLENEVLNLFLLSIESIPGWTVHSSISRHIPDFLSFSYPSWHSQP